MVYDLAFQRKNAVANPDRALKLGRWAVLAVTVFAYVMGQFFPSVLALQMYAFAMYAVAITPVVLAAVFWKRATSKGAIAGMVVGRVVAVAWQASSMSADVNAVVVALPAAVIALVLVSLATKDKHGIPDRTEPAESPVLAKREP